MVKKIDMVGVRVGRLIVIEDIGRDKRNGVIWKCKCDCGNSHITTRNGLQVGRTLSCGCLGREHRRISCTKHGKTGIPEYESWRAMRDRCFNKNNMGYKNYGGRGISVIDEWGEFKNFLSDMGAKPSPNHSLDRINNNGNYEPSNCRWATRLEQARNKRRASNIKCPNCSHVFDVMQK